MLCFMLSRQVFCCSISVRQGTAASLNPRRRNQLLPVPCRPQRNTKMAACLSSVYPKSRQRRLTSIRLFNPHQRKNWPGLFSLHYPNTQIHQNKIVMIKSVLSFSKYLFVFFMLFFHTTVVSDVSMAWLGKQAIQISRPSRQGVACHSHSFCWITVPNLVGSKTLPRKLKYLVNLCFHA